MGAEGRALTIERGLEPLRILLGRPSQPEPIRLIGREREFDQAPSPE